MIYVEAILRLHGVPTSIVSDRDPRFTSKLWERMHKQFGTTLRFSTIAHPRKNGQSERVIQILEDMLRVCALDFGNKWVDNVAYAEFSYNNSFQSTISMAPFEALYGRKCQSPLYWGKLGRDQPVSETLDLNETRWRVQLIKDRLLMAQSRQKSYAEC
jgi:transposase InsO family protein